MDRLESFVTAHMAEWTYRQRLSVTIAGMLIPLLLFADDIVLVGRDPAVVQQLLDVLSGFCANNGLTVNLDKTVWLVGGEVASTWEAPTFEYRGTTVKRVPSFKYLGLEMTGHGF